MEFVLVLLVLLVVIGLLAGPLRARGEGEAEAEAEERPLEAADLEAARDAKYAEIREAELDFRTGKLSREDWREQDRRLRAEAVEILRALDAVDAR